MAVPKQYKGLIEKSAKQWGLRPSLLAALLQQESGFNPNARSPVGAMGIAQFMPATAKDYGINPLDPSQAIPAAAKYLGRNLKTYGGNVDKTLASYNAGAGNVAKYGGVPPFKETQNYVKRIKQMEQQFAKDFGGAVQAAAKNMQKKLPDIPFLGRDLPFSPVLGAVPNEINSSPIMPIGDQTMPIPFAALAAAAASKAAPVAAGAVKGATMAQAAPAAGFFSKLMGGINNTNQLLGGLQQLGGMLGGNQQSPMVGMMPMAGSMPDVQFASSSGPSRLAQLLMQRRGLG